MIFEIVLWPPHTQRTITCTPMHTHMHTPHTHTHDEKKNRKEGTKEGGQSGSTEQHLVQRYSYTLHSGRPLRFSHSFWVFWQSSMDLSGRLLWFVRLVSGVLQAPFPCCFCWLLLTSFRWLPHCQKLFLSLPRAGPDTLKNVFREHWRILT